MHWRLKSLTTGSALVSWGSDSTCQRVSNEYFWEKSLKNTIWLQVQCHEILKYRLLLIASSQPLLLFYSSFPFPSLPSVSPLRPKKTALSPTHTAWSPTHTAWSPTHTAWSPTHTALSPTHTALRATHTAWSPTLCTVIAWSETLRTAHCSMEWDSA